MAAQLWPAILVPSDEDWMPRGGSRSGGQAFTGAEQLIVSPTARWEASLTVPCFSREAVLAMRTVLAQGRAATWLIGPREGARLPWRRDPLTGGALTERNGIPGNVDSDPSLIFRLAAAAPMNATRLSVARVQGGIVEPGQILSVAGRLHTIIALDAADDGTAATLGLTIRPWTWSAVAPGTPIEFRRPVGSMRLASDKTGAMKLQLSRTGTVTLDLVEPR